MVQYYKRKGVKLKWTEEDLAKAIEHAKHNKSIAATSRIFQVPKSTLYDRLSGRIAPDAKVAAEESEIVETCIVFASGALV